VDRRGALSIYASTFWLDDRRLTFTEFAPSVDHK
jgi:hypothetical protein